MNHYSLKPIRLDLRPSLRLTLLLVGALAAACAATFMLPVAPWQKIVAVLVMLAAAVFSIKRDARLGLRSSILALEVSANGQLSMLSRDLGWCQATVLGDSVVTPELTVLMLKPEGRRRPRAVILLSDSADAEMFRRLRVWLKWGSQALPAEG